MEKLTLSNYSLGLHIIISEGSICFNKKKFILEYKFIINEDLYLILQSNHKSLAKNVDYKLESGENLIFKINFNKDNTIRLLNPWDKCIDCEWEKLCNKFSELNFKLWKSIPKIQDDNEYEISNNKNIYFHELKKNDIIRLGNIKLILKEFHLSNQPNSSEKLDNMFSVIFKNEYSKDKICSICQMGYSDESNPLIDICHLKEEKRYNHFKCLKNKINGENNFKIFDNYGCISYYIITKCDFCTKFIPLSFYVEFENRKKKLFNLVDIPKDKNEDYLFFETLDFQRSDNYYIKYFFYVKLGKMEKNKNIENIIIGRKEDGKYKYDKLIKIGDDQKLSGQHALIEYDKENKNLILKNLSDTHNTLVLNEKFILKPNDIEHMELGNIRINAQLIENNKLNDVKKEWEMNEDEIEVRKDIKKINMIED